MGLATCNQPVNLRLRKVILGSLFCSIGYWMLVAFIYVAIVLTNCLFNDDGYFQIVRSVTDALWSRLFHYTTLPQCYKLHVKCRNAKYPNSDIQRFPVPDDKVPWRVDFPEYEPVKYTSNGVLKQPVWADPDFEVHKQAEDLWNKFDSANKVDRTSHMGEYSVVDSLPWNPIGRTGIRGRGQLGRWGPNHAADPIVTRWKIDENGKRIVNSSSKKPVLQFVAIQRSDSGEWALPGGMVDPGEVVKSTLKREFMEEAMNALEANEADRTNMEEKIDEFFSKHTLIYKGYVDDPRNTDNSWMETVAYNFHDETGEFVGKLALSAGDDAKNVKWMDIDQNLQLYASHADFIRQVVSNLGSHW